MSPFPRQQLLTIVVVGDIIVPDSELAQLNKTDEATRRKSRPELGGVAANLEVFHQLHCLVLLPFSTFPLSEAKHI